METNKKIKLDIQILNDGTICKYHKMDLLQKDIEWFRNNNYKIFEIDVGKWSSRTFHKNIKISLDFPDYYGENIHAFNDCLPEIDDNGKRGILLVFTHFDHLYSQNKDLCEAILDVIDGTSRKKLIFGKYLICLIQSDDPYLFVGKVGGYNPGWNRKEWFDKDRERS